MVISKKPHIDGQQAPPGVLRFTMSHARIEEVSDSDPDYTSDPEEDDIEDFDEREIIKARAPKTRAKAPTAASNPSLIRPKEIPTVAKDGVAFQSTTDESRYKDFQCIYPIYFDRNRTRKEGRRVSIEGAVENPLAREIVAACGRLKLETLFEPTRLHPKDWANPGRVKVKLKGGQNPAIKNSLSPIFPFLHWWFKETSNERSLTPCFYYRTSSLHSHLKTPACKSYDA